MVFKPTFWKRAETGIEMPIGYFVRRGGALLCGSTISVIARSFGKATTKSLIHSCV
ncbi:hypothetical protein HRbin21_01437 [bacterium HR21]|nr:hypothetical protein HRbin21_01437 [bacterium HR21]